MNRKILTILCSILILVITLTVAVLSSKSYSVYIKDVRAEFQNCRLTADNEGIVSLSGFQRIGDYAVVNLKAEKEGSTLASIAFLDANDDMVRMDVDIKLSVNSLGMLLFRGMDIRGWLAPLIGVTLILVVIGTYFALQFRDCIRNNIYSFSSIMNLGFTIMFAGLALIYIMLCLYVGINYKDYTTNTAFLLIENIINLLIVASVPFVLVFGAFMVFTNISLIRHEGFSFVNLLGIIISTVLIFGIVVTIYLKITANDFGMDTRVVYIVQMVMSSLFGFFECMLASSAICCMYSARKKPAFDSDYIIILGCRIRKDGTLTPLLKGRADGAIKYYNERLEKYGKKTFLIPSGGKGQDEIMAEGDAIANYLLENGIPKEQIRIENKSTNTIENMSFSKAKMQLKDKNEKVYFSTTGYHVFRSGILAEKAGLKVQGIGCKTKMYYWPNAFVREFIGMFVFLKKRLIFVMGIIAVLSAGFASILANIH